MMLVNVYILVAENLHDSGWGTAALPTRNRILLQAIGPLYPFDLRFIRQVHSRLTTEDLAAVF